MNEKFEWTNEAIALMKKLLSQGLSSSHVANELSLKFGKAMTKSGVIGKAHRMGMDINGFKLAGMDAALDREWTPQREVIIREGLLHNESYPRIAQVLNLRTRSSFTARHVARQVTAMALNKVRKRPSLPKLKILDGGKKDEPKIEYQTSTRGICMYFEGEQIDKPCGMPVKVDNGKLKAFCPKHCELVYTPSLNSRRTKATGGLNG